MKPELALCRREDLHDRPVDPGLFSRHVPEEAGSRSGQVSRLYALFLHADDVSVWECTRLPRPARSLTLFWPGRNEGKTRDAIYRAGQRGAN